MRLTFFLLLCCPLIMTAQKGSLRIDAGSVYSTATKLTGDSTCWPVVISAAVRDAETNSFLLTMQAQATLKDFAAFHRKVKLSRLNLNQQVKSGAKVFAAEDLDTATIFLKTYEMEIAKGNVANLRRVGQQFMNRIGIIEKLIAERRTEAIDAKLAQKTGLVDKRKGLLGSWQATFIGDLFAAYDGVRTGEESLAQLFFTDGVDVTVDPNTIVVIRESRIDKLDQSVRRNLALMNGSVLTKLSAKAKETNRFAFHAGTSESMVKSGKFWASALQDKKAKLSNYDGSIDLTASNVKITLQQNQGTVVEKGKPPLPPINLLASPRLIWERLDTVIYNDKILLKWTSIHGAAGYQVEVSPSENFDREVKRIPEKNLELQLTGIPMASVYIRVQAMDKYGLRGIDSPVYHLIRVKDTQPPPIQINGWETDRKYTAKDSLTIKGKTKSDATMLVDGRKQLLEADGSFSFRVAVTPPETQVKIVVTDASANISSRTLSLVPMEVEKLFRIQWVTRTDETTIYTQGEILEAHGNAYPGVRVTATLKNERVSVQTNSQGDWAISIKAVRGESLRLLFDSIEDGKTIGSKSWKVE